MTQICWRTYTNTMGGATIFENITCTHFIRSIRIYDLGKILTNNVLQLEIVKKCLTIGKITQTWNIAQRRLLYYNRLIINILRHNTTEWNTIKE